MKTAILLPDDIFERTSGRANDVGMSRSEFFARAADSQLEGLDASPVTKQIDAALVGVGKGESTGGAVEAGHGVLARSTEEW